ncbi:hypothetical protein [Nitratifractor salsuginis]|uniref:Uncharacterized protein n=1 Tax=Nitratifractor salsuginis (strain DSM 16511 / JCM 12458 / E9I37-1) TaxID=749222 RepID=E6WYE4_NITSE|nr:hypothetical protein [Nitratifractor salsuginis]ADV46456.1 hypothetical protein Nitsa_1203 [Nitratifractor salsuginis DSM 16511]
MQAKRSPSDSPLLPPPEVGERYKRRFGDGGIVEVKALSPDGFVKIRDRGVMHFVLVGTFHEFFEKAG